MRVLRIIAASPHALFRPSADPGNQAELDDSGMLGGDSAGTLVEDAYVWGYARMPLLSSWLPGFPHRMRPAMERNLVNLAVPAAQQQRRRRRLIADGENRE